MIDSHSGGLKSLLWHAHTPSVQTSPQVNNHTDSMTLYRIKRVGMKIVYQQKKVVNTERCVCCLVYLQVGAVLEPNPGVCGLESRTENGVTFDEYVNDALYVSFQKQKAAMFDFYN